MILQVYVQKPNQPHTERRVGQANDSDTPEHVAKLVGVPEGCLLEGKVIRRKGKARWSLVADVEFGSN